MFDLITSVKPDNVVTMLAAGVKEHVIDKILDPASDVIERTAHGRVAGVYPKRQKRGLGFSGGWSTCASY